MQLSSLQTEAFLAVAQEKNFTRAAKAIHVTQSALSQRIGNLEADLGHTLFARNNKVVTLTEIGERLLRHCQAVQQMENEFLLGLQSSKNKGLSGVITIGSYSSILRSVVIPALIPILIKNPQLNIHFQKFETYELLDRLNHGELDLIVTDVEITRNHIVCEAIGAEEYIAVAPNCKNARTHYYLDHEKNDVYTERFFAAQKNPPPQYRRSFISDIYGIIDGVCAGLGNGVVPKHLLNAKLPVKIIKRFKPYKVPVYIAHNKAPFQPKALDLVVQSIKSQSQKKLSHI